MIAPLRPDDPRAIGPYRLCGQLGYGGMGQVFLGLSADGQLVAVKLIRAELAADHEFRTRFRQEAAAARKVSGRFTALVVDADLDGPVPWLTTTYVAGPSLAEEVNGHGPLPADKVLSLAAGLAEGLIAIHAAGVVHRDLKPSNILLAEDGPRVIDFGICQDAWVGASPRAELGSPKFMSPEHALGQVMGPPSDIFSLGAVLTFAATGQGPFGSGSSSALMYRVVNSPALLDAVPAELRELVGSCLAKCPDDRPDVSRLLTQIRALQRQSGRLPEPAIETVAQDQPPAGPVNSPALAGVSSVEPQSGSAGRERRRRSLRSLPLLIPGLAAALAASIYLVSRGIVPSPATPAHPQAGIVTPAVHAQPQAAAGTAAPHGSSSPPQHQAGAAVIQDPSAFVSPSVLTPVLSPSGALETAGSPSPSPSSSPSPSPSSSPSPSPSPSSSPSPSPSPSSSPSTSPSASSSPSPSPSSSSPSTPATSTPSTPATSTPSTPAAPSTVSS